jgi:hypothetical protein
MGSRCESLLCWAWEKAIVIFPVNFLWKYNYISAARIPYNCQPFVMDKKSAFVGEIESAIAFSICCG